MSKSRITAAVVAMALVGMPVILGSSAAFAATSTGTTDSTPAPSFSAADRDEDEHGDEDEEKYEHNHGVLPPVVIRPHQEGDEYGEDEDGDEDDEYGDDEEGAGTLPPLPSATPDPNASFEPRNGNGFGPAYNERGAFVVAPLGAPGSGGGPRGGTPVSAIDPQAAPPISMEGVNPSAKTPSQIFMESATVGLTAMGVGAIALGGVAGVRAIRLRKNPLGDYFYDTEK
jgi:hypothetical protein